MKNGDLKPSLGEPKGDHFSISLSRFVKFTKGAERFFTESLGFYTAVPCRFSQDDIEFPSAITLQSALAIENAKMYEHAKMDFRSRIVSSFIGE